MPPNEIRQNPFLDRGRWYWRDEHQVAHGPFVHQMEALREMIMYMDPRSRWERFKALVKELIHA